MRTAIQRGLGSLLFLFAAVWLVMEALKAPGREAVAASGRMLAGASIRAPHAAVPMVAKSRTRGWTMIWRIRQRLGQWVGAAIIIALAGGLCWMAVKHAERADGPSPAAALGEAMSKAARQRMLTP